MQESAWEVEACREMALEGREAVESGMREVGAGALSQGRRGKR